MTSSPQLKTYSMVEATPPVILALKERQLYSQVICFLCFERI